MNNELLILGAGGHAKVVIEAARLCGLNPCAVYDDDASLLGKLILGVPVKGKIIDLPDDRSGSAFIAIGNTKIRRLIAQRLSKLNWPVLVHPAAYVSPSARIGKGSIVCAGAVVQPDVEIGEHVIINIGANIDHDCVIGDFVHICPGCNLAGAARVDEGAMLGSGTSVVPLKQIGSWATLGSGAAVVSDIPAGVVAVGVPATKSGEPRE